MSTLVQNAANFFLRIHYAQYELNSWSLICPANPSRLHLIINMGIESSLVIAPSTEVPVTEGLRIGDGKNYHEFYAFQSPALCSSAWYVYIAGLIPVGVVQAWETTPRGT